MECKNHQHVSGDKPKKYALYKKVLILSLIVNVCFCIGAGIYTYHKRTKIVAMFGLGQSTPTQEVLAKFNNKPLKVFHDSIITNSPDTLYFMFLGNSITRHGITDFWDHECGMAATIEKKITYINW